MVVAIDGPAGAGKSTVARRLARRIDAAYLNTGAMYRAVAWLSMREGVATDDAPALAALAEAHEIELVPVEGGERVTVDHIDVTDATKGAEVTSRVSAIAAHGAVRRVIVARQQAIIRTGDWVADGRDIGTAVAPHAEVKIFLTADPEVRARRRYDELVAGGADVELGDILQQIAERDGLDTSRTESPLVVADGAHIVDTTDRPIDQVVDTIAQLVSAAQAGAR